MFKVAMRSISGSTVARRRFKREIVCRTPRNERASAQKTEIHGFLAEEYVREARRVAHRRGTRKVSRDEEAEPCVVYNSNSPSGEGAMLRRRSRDKRK